MWVVEVAGAHVGGHDLADRSLQDAGPVGCEPPDDVALADDAGDRLAVLADDHGADPVLLQDGQQVLHGVVRSHGEHPVALAAHHVRDPHDLTVDRRVGPRQRNGPKGRRPARTPQRQRHFVQVRAPRHRVVWPNRIRGVDRVSGSTQTFDLVIAANRLPVDRVVSDDGAVEWRRSPGGLVTAMESVMRSREGAWVGWAGEAGDAPEPFDQDGMYLRPVPLSEEEVAQYYEGFSNDTLWPIYHDVIVPASFHRDWWVDLRAGQPPLRRGGLPRWQPRARPSGSTTTSSSSCRRWCASCARTCASAGSTTSRSRPWSCSPSCRGARGWSRACSAPTSSASSAVADAHNFLRACRRLLGLTTKGDTVRTASTDGGTRVVRASAIPISVDFNGLEELARTPEVIAARQGDPRVPRQPARSSCSASTGSTTPRASGTGSRRTPSSSRTAPSPRRTRSSCRSPPPAASAWRPTASCARRSRPTVGPDQRRVRRHRLAAVHYLHHSYPREEMVGAVPRR